MAFTTVLDRLEAAFPKLRAELLASDAGRWALFVQPANRRRWPGLVGCYDTESEACEISYQNPIGQALPRHGGSGRRQIERIQN